MCRREPCELALHPLATAVQCSTSDAASRASKQLSQDLESCQALGSEAGIVETLQAQGHTEKSSYPPACADQ